ncbi:MAG: DUF4886 domain-containing protein, partial [Peptococcaceae bacterium]|nr:DUF4886 domain-containing protein [Peptococcaceae bacterium]
GWVSSATGNKFAAGANFPPVAVNTTMTAAWKADNSIDYSLYKDLTWRHTDLGYWNSNNGGYAANPQITTTADNSVYFLASQRFSRAELPVGSIIEVDTGYGYRPDGWVSSGTGAPGRPGLVTTQRVVIDEAWWGSFEYRAFNVARSTFNVNLTGQEEETASHFRIYVPAYQELTWRHTDLGYWNSNNGAYAANPQVITTADNSTYFLASQRFTRAELPVGSIIEVDAGYAYRPDGWVAAGTGAPGRPGLVTTQRVVIDEAWWGSFEYRAFNVARSTLNVNLTGKEAETASHFRIYVPNQTGGPNTDHREITWRHTDLGYWNSNNGGYAANPQITTTADNSVYFLASQRFTRAELPVGSIIEVDAGYAYRPDGWVAAGTGAPGRPGLVTTQRVVIDEAWWGSFEYRAFNVARSTLNVNLTGKEEETASHFRIYVPYKPLDWRHTDLGYWNSNNGAYAANPQITTTADNSVYFLASQRFTRAELPVGSIIEVDAGYAYRPEGWVASGTGAPGRPGLVTTQRVVIDEAWWGSFEYRAFNVARSTLNVNLTGKEAETAAHFRIYVPYSPEPTEGQSIKILSIGNSFSNDGMDYNVNGSSLLFRVLRETGYTDITLGILDIGGCSLQMHWANASNNSNSYGYHKLKSQTASGIWTNTAGVTMLQGIEDEDWDIIVLQQVSGDSHVANSYGPLKDLAGYINSKKTKPNARLGWQMTWAYGLTDEVPGGGGSLKATSLEQLTMYNGIIAAVESEVVSNPAVDFIIPSGIAIQEMRGYVPGNKLIRDNGSHLSVGLGRYTAGMTWITAVTDASVDTIAYKPLGVSEAEQNYVKQAVNKAISFPGFQR